MTRRPQAFSPDDIQVEIMAAPAEETVAAEDAPPPAPPPRRQGIFGLLMAALGGLVTLTLGLWATDFVGAAFARFAALGWLALALTVLAALAAVVLLGREWLALRRLQRVETVRLAAETALAERSDRLAAEAAAKLDALLAANPQAARGRAAARCRRASSPERCWARRRCSICCSRSCSWIG